MLLYTRETECHNSQMLTLIKCSSSKMKIAQRNGQTWKKYIYNIVDYNIEDGLFGESMVLTLSDGTKVWAPEHLKEKIKRAGTKPPYNVRPLGLKPCTKNRKNKCHAYDFVEVPQ